MISSAVIFSALELGSIYALVALALFLSFRVLNIADMTTDGSFTLGCAVSATVAVAGHPLLALPAAMIAGACAGSVTALLQTKFKIPSILAGIITNTGLYTVNLAVMGFSSNVNMLRSTTLFTLVQPSLGSFYKLVPAAVITLAVGILLVLFLRTRLGLSIRATGDNPDMVRASSINPIFTTTVGLCVANAFTGLSGCLLSQSQKSVNTDIGSGMVTIALASLLIGRTMMGKGGIFTRSVGMVLGAFVFRLVYTVALRMNMPAYMLKLVSSTIVVVAIFLPYMKRQMPLMRRRMAGAGKGGN